MTVDFNRVEQTDVLLAITEYDELGSEDFLDAYGFKPGGAYLLVHEGSSYDAIALLAVAFGYATGTAAKSNEFSDAHRRSGEGARRSRLRDRGQHPDRAP